MYASSLVHLIAIACITGSRILPPQLETVITPTKASMPPEELRNYFHARVPMDDRTEAALVTEKGQQALRRMQNKLRAAARTATGDKPIAAPPGIGRSDYGAVLEWLRASTYDKLKHHAGFKSHSAYIIDSPRFIVDSERDQVVYMMTSEKMLKNIFWQADSGMPRILCMDTTHRLVAEGHSVMVLGVRDIEQKFHRVAYGVVSTDNQEHTELCLRMVADEYLRVHARCKWSSEELHSDEELEAEPRADAAEDSGSGSGASSCDEDSDVEVPEPAPKRGRRN